MAQQSAAPRPTSDDCLSPAGGGRYGLRSGRRLWGGSGDMRTEFKRFACFGPDPAPDYLLLHRTHGRADRRRPGIRGCEPPSALVFSSGRQILASRVLMDIRHLRDAVVRFPDIAVSHRRARARCGCPCGDHVHGFWHHRGSRVLRGRRIIRLQHRARAQHSCCRFTFGRRLRCIVSRRYDQKTNPHRRNLLTRENLECNYHDGIETGPGAVAGSASASHVWPPRCTRPNADQRDIAGHGRQHHGHLSRSRRDRTHRQHGNHLRVDGHRSHGDRVGNSPAPGTVARLFSSSREFYCSFLPDGCRAHGGFRAISAPVAATRHSTRMETHRPLGGARAGVPKRHAYGGAMSQSLTEHPLTRAEMSGYSETSSHADVLTFIEALRKIGGSSLYVTDFGKTPEGRVLPLLVLSNRGYFTPQEALRADLPIVLILCGIHAGEVEGKESALMLVRDILRGRHGELLDRITLLVAPLFNADGNDRIDPHNRRLDIQHLRGQIGPAGGVGTRENAAGINLNRDYMRQDSAEMRALQHRVCQPWNPHLVIDSHTTNGSIHRFAMTFDIPHVVDSTRREPIEYMRSRMLPAVQSAVKAR